MWGNFGRVILTDRLSSEVAVSLLLCKKQSSIFPRTSPNWSPTNQKLAISFFPGKKNMHLSLPHFWGSWVPTNPGMPRPVHATYATSLQWHMMAYGFKLSFRIIWSQWSFNCSKCRTGRKWRHNMKKTSNLCWQGTLLMGCWLICASYSLMTLRALRWHEISFDICGWWRKIRPTYQTVKTHLSSPLQWPMNTTCSPRITHTLVWTPPAMFFRIQSSPKYIGIKCPTFPPMPL